VFQNPWQIDRSKYLTSLGFSRREFQFWKPVVLEQPAPPYRVEPVDEFDPA
jgi:hypothetical protein